MFRWTLFADAINRSTIHRKHQFPYNILVEFAKINMANLRAS